MLFYSFILHPKMLLSLSETKNKIAITITSVIAEIMSNNA